MTTIDVRPIDHYLEKIQRRIQRRFPDLQLRVERISHDEVNLYFHSPDPEANWFPIIHCASGIAVDALVDHDYKINVLPE